jgi:hypothetical protein
MQAEKHEKDIQNTGADLEVYFQGASKCGSRDTRLVDTRSREGRSASHSFRNLLFLLAYRSWRSISNIFFRTCSGGLLSKLESPADTPGALILSDNPNLLGESAASVGDGSRSGETQSRIGEGRIKENIMPFLHLRVWGSPPERDAIEDVLNKAKDWYRYSPNCWIIYTARDAQWWYERLSNIPGMKNDASFFIAEMRLSNRAGWATPGMWKWIEKNRT